MSKKARSIIGNNVRQIRKALGLSLLDFSILCELSKASIVNIEAGRNGYNLNLLDNIVSFTRFSLKELSDESFKPGASLRDNLIKHYKSNHQFFAILSSKPNIVYAIKHKILGGTFLDQPKEIKEIKAYLDGFGWDYKNVSISVALKRMDSLIDIQLHPTKKGTSIYSRK